MVMIGPRFRTAIPPVWLVLALYAAMCCLPSALQAQVPSDVAPSLKVAAERNLGLTRQEVALARTLGNPQLAADFERRGLRRLESEIATLAIHWISQHPDRAGDIAAAATDVASTVKTPLALRLHATFPGLATEIARATGVPAPATLLPPPRRVEPMPTTVASPPLYATAPAPRPVLVPGVAARTPVPQFDAEEDLRILGMESISDPLETVNRVIFAFNDALDIMVLRPIAAVYGFIAPEIVKSAVRRIFENLNLPVVFVNDLLQFDVLDAGVTSGRFAINTTAGILGIFDWATAVGFEAHYADFGQTLHSYGLGPGPYIVLPILGPSTTRDAVGDGVDIFFQPLTYILDSEINLAIAGAEAMVLRESLLKALDDLRISSVDYYAALRAAYYQNRSIDLHKGRAGDNSSVDALFDRAE